MPDTLLSFHYMTVLRELEKSVVELHPDPLVSKVSNHALADLVGKLYDRVSNLPAQWGSLEERIDFELGAEQGRQLKIEGQIVAHIERLTSASRQAAQHRQLTGDWPPMIPLARIVEHFTALTIGLHSEKPAVPFCQHIVAAFREAVLPGLAWGLMVRLYAHPKATRPALQAAISLRLREADTSPHLKLSQGEKVSLDYLLMVDAWFDALRTKPLGAIDVDVVRQLRGELAELMSKELGELDTLLWERLGSQYLAVLAGTERAMAVERAEKHSQGSSAFLRPRLALFEAAQEPTLQPFRHLTENELEKSLRWPFEALTAAAHNIEAGKAACGGAFWLARATFGQHAQPDDEGLPMAETTREKASTLAVLLLVRAGLMFKHQAAKSEGLLTCLRYAAGYATNPRYVRSLSVLHHQEKLVDLYEQHPDHRASLVKIFRGRIAWQQWVATELKPYRKEALKSYHAALQGHRLPTHGFDAEAPVHFFPELTCLLRATTSKSSKAAKTLDAVDFITQRNYGVYFDIDRERANLDAGLTAFGRYHRMKTTAELDSPLVKHPKETQARIAAFTKVTTSAEAKATRDAIGEISRALQFNR
jgi:hypothetical protein